MTTAWRQGKNKARLRADMEAALAPRPVIKHCYEIMSTELNRTLMEVASGLGYVHVSCRSMSRLWCAVSHTKPRLRKTVHEPVPARQS